MKTVHLRFLNACFLFLLSSSALHLAGQSVQVVASGFIGIGGLSRDAAGNLWVTESGTGNGDGRVSMITPSGTLYPVITDLPSFVVDTTTGETSGPARAYVSNNQLLVLVGGGSDINAGSLLTFDLSAYTPGGPVLSVNQATHAIHIGAYLYGHGFTDSNPYRVAWDAGNNAYFADAGANAIVKHSALGDSLSVVHVFPPIPNTFTPFPPVIDYVPTCIAANPSGGFYVGNLTGFPFIPGLSNVLKMDAAGNTTPFADNLTLTVDMQVEPGTGNLYVLQFGVFDSTFAPVFNSSVIRKITPSGQQSVFASGFGPGAGMALDGSGGVFVTNLFTGQVLHISSPTATQEQASDLPAASAWPNPAGTQTTLRFDLNGDAAVHYALFDARGMRLRQENLGRLPAGEHAERVGLEALPAGLYYISVWTERGSRTVAVVKE